METKWEPKKGDLVCYEGKKCKYLGEYQDLNLAWLKDIDGCYLVSEKSEISPWIEPVKTEVPVKAEMVALRERVKKHLENLSPKTESTIDTVLATPQGRAEVKRKIWDLEWEARHPLVKDNDLTIGKWIDTVTGKAKFANEKPIQKIFRKEK